MFAHERSLVQKYRDRPFALLGVNLDSLLETFQDCQKESRLNWRSWWDKSGIIADQWGINGIPALFLIDRKGMVRWHQTGVPDSKELDKRIEQLVKEAEGKELASRK